MRYVNLMLLSVLFFIIPTAGFAGSLNDPGAPTDPASAMCTVTDVYNRINDGTAGTTRTTFREPIDPPGQTGKTLNDLYGIASQRSRPAKIGQTPTVPFAAPAGSDGALQKGVSWPSPRFTNNNNGTVTDKLTGLIWLKAANYNDTSGTTGTATWANALAFYNALESGQCGLTDNSSAGDWRLPNRFELESLLDLAYNNPALSNDAGTDRWGSGTCSFTGVQSEDYWSSSTYASSTDVAWYVNLNVGYVRSANKSETNYVWPVRGGQ